MGSQDICVLEKKEEEDGINTLIRRFSIKAAAQDPESELAQQLKIEEVVKYEQEELRASRPFRHLYEDNQDLKRLAFPEHLPCLQRNPCTASCISLFCNDGLALCKPLRGCRMICETQRRYSYIYLMVTAKDSLP